MPSEFARTARLARQAGFGGVQIHAAHGFLLNQFLSPLFNRRSDEYAGVIAHRMRLVLESIDATRAAVGSDFPIAVKLNSSDRLECGFSEDDALEVVAALDRHSARTCQSWLMVLSRGPADKAQAFHIHVAERHANVTSREEVL